jgi:hypothetical protein
MTDAITKYVELVAIPNKEAATVGLQFFNKWICTFMGLYKAHEMNILQKQLNSLAAKHNFLVSTTKQQQEHLSALNEKLIELANLVQQMLIHNPTLIATHIEEQLNIFQDRVTRVTNVVQELHHLRLS